ncbi:UBP-type zinc finger domain-containing protein [Mucilaginibacter sp.]|uniref:UBP-type zinc finger domain-containing protein n=1 Tax=Mucilaginibacter sp. TaxID=1882438 RepID=UPI00261E3C22|nr:UBP-type zinc finger domain-containing protein [Mucilaginibacter sp.]MDB4924599.1 hypothetical protein [Mucilaginibacter sp.]
MENEQLCEHLRQIKTIIQPKELVCEECIKTGDDWVHLRTCQTCGVTLCCDDSPNTHITKHYHATDHPVIISAQPGEQWLWCYKDEIFAEY